MPEQSESTPKKAPKRAKAARRGSSKKRVSSPAEGEAIAITGAVGFLGAHLLSYLRGESRFERVVVLDVAKPTLPIRKTKFYKTDLTEPNCDARIAEIFERENVTQVIHLAFFRSPHRNAAYAHELEVIGTLHLLHACAQAKVKKFLTVTSSLVYGAHPDNPNFLTERHELRAKSSFPHVANKAEAEGVIARFAKQHPEMRITVLRPAIILGPRRRAYVTSFFSRASIPTVLGYDPLMQFVHEDDVIDIIQRCIAGDQSGVYNIVGSGVLPLSTILRVGGKWSVAVPSFVLYPSARALWTSGASDIPPEFYDYLRYLCIADGEKARRELGFEPRHSTKDTWLSFTGEERVRQFRAAS